MSGVTSQFLRISTPAFCSLRVINLITLHSSCLPIGTAAKRSSPPSSCVFSHKTTSCPRIFAIYAASIPAGPPPITNTFFFSTAGATASDCTDGLTVHEIGLPNIIPVRQRPQPIQGRISSVFPANALLANALSQRLGLPIIQISVFPFAINSSAIHGSLMRATVETGIFRCLRISSAACAWGAGEVPGAGIELPRLMVLPPDT